MKVLVVESNTPDQSVDDVELFREVLHAIDPSVEISAIYPYADPSALPDLDRIDGVIFTGSGVDWGVDDPRAEPLCAVARAVFAAKLPAYGSCNGMQLGAYMFGGAVGNSPNGRENGLARDIQLTDAGRAHPFLAGRQDGYAVPCVHRDEVTRLPDGAVLLAGNAHSPVQAFAYEQGGQRFWGVQYHPEVSPTLMADILPKVGDYPDTICDAFRRAETDAGAARQLGAAPGDLLPDQRVTEIRNWLASLSA
jgi:GMP synthase (glutamine-hydrolysing)